MTTQQTTPTEADARYAVKHGVSALMTKAWSTVVDAQVEHDPEQGTFELHIFKINGVHLEGFTLDSVNKRAALIEATTWMEGLDYEPAGRWNNIGVRRFKRVES